MPGSSEWRRALAVVGGVRIARLGFTGAAIGRLVALTALIVVVVLALHSPELLLTRISSEGSQAWYGARYEVPVTLDLDTARTHQIPITLDEHRPPDVGLHAAAGICGFLPLAARRIGSGRAVRRTADAFCRACRRRVQP